MKDRVIFGATSAIAVGVAQIWARRGDQLTLVGRNGNRLAAIAKDLQSRGASQVEVIVMDFSDPIKLWEQVEEFFGEKERVDTLLVAQGFMGYGSEQDLKPKRVHDILDVNFESAAMVLLAAKSHFIKNNYGTMAAFSAVEGDVGRSTTYLYGSAKAALKVLLSGLREELTPKGVKVTTIIPARVETPLNKDVPRDGRFWTNVEKVAQDIAYKIDEGANVYTPIVWKFISWLRRVLPEGLARKLKV
ncbi:MAG: SDR family NAD(P)-dependent oxidoreductase [Bdellovibrionaceae bacterium]|nr:SDR family NAD(P)-dependent oxidoreductase [Pseudobdellovibrionaceae bacterium]